MDLSHAEFIHVDTFRTESKIFAGTDSVGETNDGAIWSKWSLRNTARRPWLTSLPEEARLDEWLYMRWHAPASMLLHIGFTLAGTPREEALHPGMVNPHIITPDTKSSSHYFFTRDPGEESAAMAHQVFEEEDRPMLESIQATMGENDFLGMEAGDTQCRRCKHPRQAAADEDAGRREDR
jgi:vanillate O-demethylase monooxygenase subunit